MSADSRRAAIRRFMEAQRPPLKVSPWATKAGIKEGTLRAFLSGKSNAMRHDTLEKLADAANASVSEVIGEKPRAPQTGRDVSMVKSLAVQAAMGAGVEVADEVEGEPFFFRRDYLDRITGKAPAMLRVIELTGDSNEPELHNGDVAMVHLGRRDIVGDPGFFVAWDGNGLIVKRFQLLPGERLMLRVLSANPAYPPYDVPADTIQIIGRVIWTAREL